MLDLSQKAIRLIGEVFRPGGMPVHAADGELVEEIRAAALPPLELVHVTGAPYDDDPEDERHGLECPYCGAITWDGDTEGIRVVDIAVRWNPFGYRHDKQLITGSYDNDSQFDGDHYACEACDHRVALPDDVTESGW